MCIHSERGIPLSGWTSTAYHRFPGLNAFSTSNPATGCFSRWEHWFTGSGSSWCAKRRDATRRLWQVIRLPSGVWQYLNPTFSMESVAAIFSLVAKALGAFEDPVCENVSIFRRLSQGCFVV